MKDEFPSPPWSLCGQGMALPRLIRVEHVRRLIPPELRIFQVLPGKTAGGLFLARYEPGSTLAYSELIVAAATVYRAGRIGIWISHIYVDSAESVAGGREIWGLPKELAEFTWEKGKTVVRQGDRELCSVLFTSGRCRVPAPLWLPAFGRLEGRLLHFTGVGAARLALGRAEWIVPKDSPFWGVLSGGEGLTLLLDGLHVRVGAPHPAITP